MQLRQRKRRTQEREKFPQLQLREGVWAQKHRPRRIALREE